MPRVHVDYEASYSRGGVVLLSDAEYQEYLDWIQDGAPSNDSMAEFLRSTWEDDDWWHCRLVEEADERYSPDLINLKVTQVEED